MKISTLGIASILSSCLLAAPLVQASSFESAVTEAKIELDKAKAVNYEWRDSRKLLKKAEKLNKEGKTDKAIKLVNKAKMQGKLAVAQAELQSGVQGPHR